MGIGLTNEDNYQAIADAIREKNGSTQAYYPEEMATAILAIETANEISLDGVVLYNAAQELSNEEKQQARSNIGAASVDDIVLVSTPIHVVNYSDLVGDESGDVDLSQYSEGDIILITGVQE